MVRKVYAKVLLDNLFYDVSMMFNNKTDPEKILFFINKKMRELKGRDYYKVVWYEEKAYNKIRYDKEVFKLADEEKTVVRNGMIIEE